MIASDEKEMAKLVNLVKITSERPGICINASKMKVMEVDWAKCLPVSTALSEYEKVNAFVHLRFIIKVDRGSSATPDRSERISYD